MKFPFRRRIFLEGGIKHKRKSSKKPEGTHAKRIKRGNRIGVGGEGNVYEVEVAIGNKKLKMVEKQFKRRRKNEFEIEFPLFRNPEIQFSTMNELMELNRTRRKAGKPTLRIVKTIRLRRRFGKRPTLVMTRLEPADMQTLSEAQAHQFFEDKSCQYKILTEEGFTTFTDGMDVFIPIFDPKDKSPRDKKKVIAVIADFGTIRKKFKI